MSKIVTKHLYYVKDKITGNVIPVNVRGGKEETEKQNLKLRKEGKEHLIRFEVVEPPEEVKKAGRPKKEE